MPWLFFILGSGHCLLHFAANASSRRKGIDSSTRLDTTPCQSPTTSLNKILPTEPDMEHLCHSACTTKHTKRWRKPRGNNTNPFWKGFLQVFVWYWLEWGRKNAIRQDRIGGPFLHCDDRRKKSEREFMDTLIACRRCTRTIESARRLSKM